MLLLAIRAPNSRNPHLSAVLISQLRIWDRLAMILALLVTLAAVQQPPLSSLPPAPQPPPVATTPKVRAALDAARTCFDQRWQFARERRFAAERMVLPLTAQPGSAEWLSARTSVLALVAARRELSECPKQINRLANMTDADRAAQAYWLQFMIFNINEQAPFEKGLLFGLVDRSLADSVFGPRP